MSASYITGAGIVKTTLPSSIKSILLFSFNTGISLPVFKVKVKAYEFRRALIIKFSLRLVPEILYSRSIPGSILLYITELLVTALLITASFFCLTLKLSVFVSIRGSITAL